jgi:hypothetical protein
MNLPFGNARHSVEYQEVCPFFRRGEDHDFSVRGRPLDLKSRAHIWHLWACCWSYSTDTCGEGESLETAKSRVFYLAVEMLVSSSRPGSATGQNYDSCAQGSHCTALLTCRGEE